MDEKPAEKIVYQFSARKDWVDYTIDFLVIGATLAMVIVFAYQAYFYHKLR